MPNPPRQTTVFVILKSVNPTKFELQPVGDDPLPPPSGPNQTLDFKNDPHGVPHNGVNIDFVLIDQSNEGGYAFPPNANKAQAVSSQLGPTSGCPPQGTNEVFNPIIVGGPNNNTLRVQNPNQGNVTGFFSYVLWVTRDGGQNYVGLDPGGNNMNGAT